METFNLFYTSKNQYITNIDLYNTLLELKADKAEILYIHSALNFGLLNQNLTRNIILESLFEVISELKVKTICMPTFTFSFCNNQIYDIKNSTSKMGAFNEFFRKKPEVIRSEDPLLSVALLGEHKDLIENLSNYSIGKDSTFDKIHKNGNVKFLFLGPDMGSCFTYMHYLEWLYNVDYRYNRLFSGEIQTTEHIVNADYWLFVRYKEVFPNNGSYLYEQWLYNNKIAKRISLGDSAISIVAETDATKAYKYFLDKDPYFFVSFSNNVLEKDKTFVQKAPMVSL